MLDLMVVILQSQRVVLLGNLIANIPCLQWFAGIVATIPLGLNLYFRD